MKFATLLNIIESQIIDELNFNEAVDVHGDDLWAYAAVVAEAYDNKPLKEPVAIELYKEFVKSNANLYKKFEKAINIRRTEHDPYDSLEDIAKDIKGNKQVSVYSGHSDHPALTQDENIVFRVVHDYFSHFITNHSSVVPFKSHNFTLRGELNAYLSHVKLASKAVIPVIFTEIIGQASYFAIMHRFPTQKAIVLSGFDYRNIGKFTDGSRQARFREILSQLQDDSLDYVDLNINGKIKYPKAKIKPEFQAFSGFSKNKERERLVAGEEDDSNQLKYQRFHR